MGRSNSCFKLIACGGDSADEDDLQAPENKSSGDRRGWSFRKRSAHHRVLSNTVITEAPYSANKESSESASHNFQLPDTSAAPEKISVIQCTDEKTQLSTFLVSKESETVVATKDDSEVKAEIEESVVIVIQAAVRGFLAQRELLKLKNLVKLQAAVRGHLVRQHAVGTLRCVQAIVKMQALVRARRARLLQEGSSSEKRIDEKTISKTSGEENSINKPDLTYTSFKKLLGNRFAQQLMESAPKNRPIYIKCDSSKPNSAWNWLERWMSVSSAEPTPQPELKTKQLERENDGNLATVVDAAVPSDGFSESADSKSNAKENVLAYGTEDNRVTYDANEFKVQENQPTSSFVGDNLEQPQSEKISTSDAKEASIDVNSLPNHTIKSDENSQVAIDSLSHKSEIEVEQTDQPKRPMKRYASEQLDTEGKKFVFGSRKVSNPAFIAVQSKFEELSSTANSNKSSSSCQDGGIESNMDTISSSADTVARTKELNIVENLLPSNLKGQYGDSECGTELSVTSTLDSPDIFEVGAAEYEHETKSLEKETCNPNSTIDVVVEAKNTSTDPVSNSSDCIVVQPEKLDIVKSEPVDSVVAEDSSHVELKPERNVSDVQRELHSETGGPAYRSSPEASPRSHLTVPESQGTPSSQVSVNAKRNRTDKSGSGHKRNSLSAGRYLSNPNQGSGARNSMEQLSKDQNNGKRRNSFGSTRPDQTDQEPRYSSSSSSLPHFMQATESARAKIQANNSPRSSPDVQDRDYVKKRHSLPGSNGRQRSPCIQRSMSQAQPDAKGNVGHVMHEKKWQR